MSEKYEIQLWVARRVSLSFEGDSSDTELVARRVSLSFEGDSSDTELSLSLVVEVTASPLCSDETAVLSISSISNKPESTNVTGR
jgi:hypothetical protein